MKKLLRKISWEMAFLLVVISLVFAADQSAIKVWIGNTSNVANTVSTVSFGFLSRSVEVENTDSTDILQVSLDGGTDYETLNAGDKWHVNPLARRNVLLKSTATTVAYEIRAGKAE